MTGRPGPVSLAPSARRILDLACALAGDDTGRRCGVDHYLEAILQIDESLVGSVTGGELEKLPDEMLHAIAARDAGRRLAVEVLVTRAWEAASRRGSAAVWDIDVAAAVLQQAGIWRDPAAPPDEWELEERRALLCRLCGLLEHLAGEPDEEDADGSLTEAETEDLWSQFSGLMAPALTEYGRDLTLDAAKGRLAPVVGRDAEVQACIEVLCRVTKRNPVLLGPAGVGKTAIVEGLAQRIAGNDVPAPLVGTRIIELLLTQLVSKSGSSFPEERVNDVLSEARSTRAILFIDELHTVLGSGQSYRDISQFLKPALARGDVAVIGATTDEEYARIADQDAALERRFTPVTVGEMDRRAALRVLQAHRDRLQELRQVALSDDVLDWLVDFAHDYMRNRHFPDKALDLLEQCIAHAVVSGRGELDRETAETVAQQLVGMPLDASTRLSRLADKLTVAAILTDADRLAMLDKLRVTIGGHDFEPARPNAAVLLVGGAAGRADLLAALCADALYGSSQRVVSIDLAGLVSGDNAAYSQLFGIPYGYVGADLNKGAVQVLNNQPWTAVILRNVDLCDQLFRGFVADALACGYFVDAHRAKQYLSDAVVFVTAGETDPKGSAGVGFVGGDSSGSAADLRRRLEKLLGKGLVSQCQIVAETGSPVAAARGWLTLLALPALEARYARDGLEISWDEAAVDWLAAAAAPLDGPDDWRRLLESELGPVFAGVLEQDVDGALRITVDACGERLVAARGAQSGGGRR